MIYWVPNKPPMITAKPCNIKISKNLDSQLKRLPLTFTLYPSSYGYNHYKMPITWLTKEIVDSITLMCSLQNNLNVLSWEHNKSLKHTIKALALSVITQWEGTYIIICNKLHKNSMLDFKFTWLRYLLSFEYYMLKTFDVLNNSIEINEDD